MILNRKWFSLFPFNFISFCFHFLHNFRHSLLKFPNRHSIAWMERQCDHTFHSRKINFNQTVVICSSFRGHLTIRLFTTVLSQKTLRLFICTPDTGQRGAFCGHYINPHPVFHAYIGNTISNKF